MPVLRAGDWVYDQGEQPLAIKHHEARAENKPGHRPLNSYRLPKWVYHPDRPGQRIVINREDYFGMAADGLRNFENWNVAHVAAFHDDLKLLSLATVEQCKEPNKWGMTPAHMCGMGQHPYGPSLCVLYELVQMGVADPEALNHADQTPWHVCQRMQKPTNVKKFEKVLLKGIKPDNYDQMKESALRLRGKYARAAGVDVVIPKDPSLSLPTCLIFPGQGAQFVGMIKSLKDLPPVQDIIEKANAILGYDLLDIMLNGPEEKLAQTKFCQPAMYVAGLAAYERLKLEQPEKAIRCAGVAGLSIGEYTALTVAGVMDLETGLKVIKARAEAMEFESVRKDAKQQGMMLLAGLERAAVEQLCKETSAEKKGETCQIAAYLFPRAFSVSGSEVALQSLERKAQDAGALQTRTLKTSGAFHSQAMESVRAFLVQQLDANKSSMKPPRCSVYMNSTALPIGPSTPVKDIVKLLADQMVQPVLWEQSIQQAIRDGCAEFFELGPGQQLKGMMRRIDPKVADKMSNVFV